MLKHIYFKNIKQILIIVVFMLVTPILVSSRLIVLESLSCMWHSSIIHIFRIFLIVVIFMPMMPTLVSSKSSHVKIKGKIFKCGMLGHMLFYALFIVICSPQMHSILFVLWKQKLSPFQIWLGLCEFQLETNMFKQNI